MGRALLLEYKKMKRLRTLPILAGMIAAVVAMGSMTLFRGSVQADITQGIDVWPNHLSTYCFVVALLSPIVMAVITGSVNFYGNQQVLTSGFDSLTSQVTLFYSFLFFSVGIACLASAAWRMEHQGTNWNLLLTTNDQILRLVLAKAGAIALGVLAMQVVLITLTYASGRLILGATGNISTTFFLVALVTVVTALPLITLQSLLSMVMRSFAAPVALSFIGCIPAIAFSMKEETANLALLLPQGINLQALQIGSVATSNAGRLDLATLSPLLGASLAHTLVYVAVAVLVVRIVKLR